MLFLVHLHWESITIPWELGPINGQRRYKLAIRRADTKKVYVWQSKTVERRSSEDGYLRVNSRRNASSTILREHCEGEREGAWNGVFRLRTKNRLARGSYKAWQATALWHRPRRSGHSRFGCDHAPLPVHVSNGSRARATLNLSELGSDGTNNGTEIGIALQKNQKWLHKRDWLNDEAWWICWRGCTAGFIS